MAESSHRRHPDDELRSDLDLMIEMAHDAKQDQQSVRRHLESLKAKLDKFVHERGTHSAEG
jgi:uncharacterized membrane-anchored protein YhcB (DUF1043 family)